MLRVKPLGYKITDDEHDDSEQQENELPSAPPPSDPHRIDDLVRSGFLGDWFAHIGFSHE